MSIAFICNVFLLKAVVLIAELVVHLELGKTMSCVSKITVQVGGFITVCDPIPALMLRLSQSLVLGSEDSCACCLQPPCSLRVLCFGAAWASAGHTFGSISHSSLTQKNVSHCTPSRTGNITRSRKWNRQFHTPACYNIIHFVIMFSIFRTFS